MEPIPDSALTTLHHSFAKTGAAPPERTSARAVEMIEGAPPDADGEFDALLANRFERACYVFVVAYAGLLVRDLFFIERAGIVFQRIVIGSGFGLQIMLTLMVRYGLTASRGRRQIAQYATILIAWAALGSTQYDFLRNQLRSPELNEVYWTGSLQIVLANTSFFPWFALIAGYPVLVPMSWRRAVAFASGTSIVPVVVTVLVMLTTSELTIERTSFMFVQFAIWALIGTFIAGYGAAQSGALRKEAFEARRFGQYILRKHLGTGGMGEVYLAEHRLLKRPSVIKLIRPDRSADPKLIMRFEREVKILATLTHWNTVDVYDYGYTPDGTFYFVMEYLPGMNLDELVKRHGPVAPGRVVFLISQICRGLREAHSVGMIHRDIKPSNIMATTRGGLQDVAKLLDFGLVLGPDETGDSAKLTREGAIIGTPHYMSPEQARGDTVDARSDVYSLGVTMHFMLAGKPLFDAKSLMEILAAHLMTEPTPLREIDPQLPADLEEIILKCLRKNPRSRYGDIRELEIALQSCAAVCEWNHDIAADWWSN